MLRYLEHDRAVDAPRGARPHQAAWEIRAGECCASFRVYSSSSGSNDRRLALIVRHGIAIFVLVMIIIIVVGSRGGIVLPLSRFPSAVKKGRGMRWVMSAPCRMSRHLSADVTVRA